MNNKLIIEDKKLTRMIIPPNKLRAESAYKSAVYTIRV